MGKGRRLWQASSMCRARDLHRLNRFAEMADRVEIVARAREARAVMLITLTILAV